mmetsp:Transcript_111114/g.313495  ORF Transcript_111114/g.313495 Transcript_111114/m.313495 type:complete len:544 (+) Transcript_111114:505-2136(+)
MACAEHSVVPPRAPHLIIVVRHPALLEMIEDGAQDRWSLLEIEGELHICVRNAMIPFLAQHVVVLTLVVRQSFQLRIQHALQQLICNVIIPQARKSEVFLKPRFLVLVAEVDVPLRPHRSSRDCGSALHGVRDPDRSLPHRRVRNHSGILVRLHDLLKRRRKLLDGDRPQLRLQVLQRHHRHLGLDDHPHDAHGRCQCGKSIWIFFAANLCDRPICNDHLVGFHKGVKRGDGEAPAMCSCHDGADHCLPIDGAQRANGEAVLFKRLAEVMDFNAALDADPLVRDIDAQDLVETLQRKDHVIALDQRRARMHGAGAADLFGILHNGNHLVERARPAENQGVHVQGLGPIADWQAPQQVWELRRGQKSSHQAQEHVEVVAVEGVDGQELERIAEKTERPRNQGRDPVQNAEVFEAEFVLDVRMVEAEDHQATHRLERESNHLQFQYRHSQQRRDRNEGGRLDVKACGPLTSPDTQLDHREPHEADAVKHPGGFGEDVIPGVVCVLRERHVPLRVHDLRDRREVKSHEQHAHRKKKASRPKTRPEP